MKLTWHRRTLHLKHPFNIASVQRAQTTEKEVLLVHIEHGGQVGWGEAAPVSYYHQTKESAEAALERVSGRLGDDPFALEKIHSFLWREIPDQAATIAAIDEALHDLVGKLLGVPIWKLLGFAPQPIPLTCYTIGIDSPETITRKTEEAAEFPLLKIKIGTDHDEEILAAVRKAAPNKVLRVDANGGWQPHEALQRMKKVLPFNVEMIEQPVPQGTDLRLVEPLYAANLVPIYADESCLGEKSVLECAGRFHGIVIKLSKCGGIRPALRMIHVARAAGLKIMLGCMVETSIGISSATQLAPLVDLVDLDGHMLLADDPFEGLGGAGGKLILNDRPGLGLVER